jgi:hypothetical protein
MRKRKKNRLSEINLKNKVNEGINKLTSIIDEYNKEVKLSSFKYFDMIKFYYCYVCIKNKNNNEIKREKMINSTLKIIENCLDLKTYIHLAYEMNYMKKILQSFSDNLMQLNLKTNLNFDENLIKSSNEIYDNNLLQIPIISYSLDENNVENNILGIGDWGLGIGDWGLGPIPNPQSPIPNPQSPSKLYVLIHLFI